MDGQQKRKKMKIDSDASSDYFRVRLKSDRRRTVTWKALCKHFFQSYVDEDAIVLEIGAGYCDFINNIQAQKKIALDAWSEFARHANSGIETHIGDVIETSKFVTSKVNLVFASNLFEHLTKNQVKEVLFDLKKIMVPTRSHLILLQPNFRLNPGRYFDDYTHESIWTDNSLSDFLAANGYETVSIFPKFLPLTVKSKIPVSEFLIWVYLKSPIKLRAGQMLIIAKPVS